MTTRHTSKPTRVQWQWDVHILVHSKHKSSQWEKSPFIYVIKSLNEESTHKKKTSKRNQNLTHKKSTKPDNISTSEEHPYFESMRNPHTSRHGKSMRNACTPSPRYKAANKKKMWYMCGHYMDRIWIRSCWEAIYPWSLLVSYGVKYNVSKLYKTSIAD